MTPVLERSKTSKALRPLGERRLVRRLAAKERRDRLAPCGAEEHVAVLLHALEEGAHAFHRGRLARHTARRRCCALLVVGLLARGAQLGRERRKEGADEEVRHIGADHAARLVHGELTVKEADVQRDDRDEVEARVAHERAPFHRDAALRVERRAADDEEDVEDDRADDGAHAGAAALA